MTVINREVRDGDRFVGIRKQTKYVVQAKEVKGKGDDEDEMFFRVVRPTDFKGPEKHAKEEMHGGKDGKTFDSLNRAVTAISYPSANPNAWAFFTREEDWSDEPKVKVEKPVKAAKEPKVKAAKATKPSKGDGKNLGRSAKTKKAKKSKAKISPNPSAASYSIFTPMAEDGVIMVGSWWCSACMNSFKDASDATKGEFPATCANGHKTEDFKGDAGSFKDDEELSEELSVLDSDMYIDDDEITDEDEVLAAAQE